MKKHVLICLTFVPIIVGYIRNLTVLLPGIGIVLYYLLPLLTTVFWFYLGKQFAHTTWKTIPAMLFGNATGTVSLLVYLFQLTLPTEEARNTALAGASQLFSSSAPGFLLGRFAMLFESAPNTITMASAIALKVISTVYMIAIFCVAFLLERRKVRKTQIQ